MVSGTRTILAQARTDGEDRLVQAEEPLAGLQLRSGGKLPGTVAVPELLALARKSRLYGLRLARMVRALDGDEQVQAWIEATPVKQEGGGCDIAVASWQVTPIAPEDEHVATRRRIEIDRATAELSARLDPDQNLLAFETEARDLRAVAERMREGAGRPWTDFVELDPNSHRQPLHWRLLDGAKCRIEGSEREWTASLLPLGQPDPGSNGFELYLVADRALAEAADKHETAPVKRKVQPIGRELSPVLRQPIARIIANAETIRTRLAGPVAEEYSNYASDIASAGQHLLSLLDDLTDLEVVESDDFSTAPDRVDLMDIVKRATGILGVRAREKDITLEIEGDTRPVLAIGEFRRVLQVLLNLVGNAIKYSPAGSTVTIALARTGDRALVIVADEGPGLSGEQQDAIFSKFERLGRSGDGGSGLGLYISRRLAEAMEGELTVDSSEGEGASFTLALPALEDGRKQPR